MIGQFGERMTKQFNEIYVTQVKRAQYKGPNKIMHMDMFNLTTVVRLREQIEFMIANRADMIILIKKYKAGAEPKTTIDGFAKIAENICQLNKSGSWADPDNSTSAYSKFVNENISVHDRINLFYIRMRCSEVTPRQSC